MGAKVLTGEVPINKPISQLEQTRTCATTKRMKLKLVFDDWQKDWKSVYNTEEGVDLSLRSFHAGTTFNAEIQLDQYEEEELKKALSNGFVPFFYVIEDTK